MTQEPNDKSKPKKVNGKDYWWCPNHGCFTHHKPTKCKGIGFKPGVQSGNNNNQKNLDSNDKEKNKLARALEAI